MSVTIRSSLCASVAFGSLAFASAACAQEVGSSAGGAPAAAASADESRAEAIVITGSRIQRKDYTSQSPLVTVGQEQITSNAGVTVERGLNELPQITPTQSETSNDTGSTNTRGGQARLNLRGLGSARTLVLLDGRRLQPSGEDNSVDVTSIPQALIKNVEIITGGASATYGSDAVAGVVNFQLDRRFSGFQIEGKYGNTEKGDGETKQVSLTLGNSFDDDRGHFAISVGYADRTKLLGADRDFFSFGTLSGTLDLTIIPNSTNTRYSQSAINTVFAKYGIPAGAVASSNGFGANADGTLFSTGTTLNNFRAATTNTDANSRYVPSATGVLYRSALDNLIRTPQTRYSGFATADYELSDSFKPFVTLNYTDYQTVTQLNPIGANAGVGLTVSPNNVFIPADLKTLLNSRSASTVNLPFVITKRLVELGSRVQNLNHTVFQMTVGATGNLPIKDWTYELYGSYGRDNTNNVLAGYGSVAAYNVLLGAADGGQSTCAGGYNPFAANFTLSAACRAYLTRTLHIDQKLQQRDFALNVQGGLFDLPAGELRFAAGLGSRENTYTYEPDDSIKQGDAANFAKTASTYGKTTVREAYVELLVPVLRDLPLIKSLNIGAGYRISDYNTVGSVGTYKVNADWEIGAGFMVRGGVQRAIRAPSVGELYSPPVAALNAVALDRGVRDPCDIRGGYRTGADGAKVRAICLAQGIPTALIDTYTFLGNNAQATTSGNPSLREETADSWTFGGVWRSQISSPLLRRLSFSVDYYNIKVKNAVGRLSLPQLFQFCFNSDGTTNPTYSPANQYCAAIKRDTQTGTLSFDTLLQNFNLATVATSGLDFQLDWSADLDAFAEKLPGRVSLNIGANRLLKFSYQSLPTQPSFNYAGSIGSGLLEGGTYPKFKLQSTFGYQVGGFNFNTKVRYMSAMVDSTRVTNSASTTKGVPSYTYVDLSAGYKFTKNLGLTVGVTNVGDRQPPVVSEATGVTDTNTYDILGRSYFVQVTAKF